MSILNKVSQMVYSSINYNHVFDILKKYDLSLPLEVIDLIDVSPDDLKSLISILNYDDLDYVIDAVSSHLLVVKVNNENSGNMFLKSRFNDSMLYLKNIIVNLNVLLSKANSSDSELAKKFKTILNEDGTLSSVTDFTFVDELLSSLPLTIKEKADFKRELGKSNIRLAHEKLDFVCDEAPLDLASSLIEDNLNMFDFSSLDGADINNLSNDDIYKFRRLSIINALKLEINKARINKFNKNVYNACIKLINKYVNALKIMDSDDFILNGLER